MRAYHTPFGEGDVPSTIMSPRFRAQSVVFRHNFSGDVIRCRSIARHGSHYDPVLQSRVPDADRLE